MYSVQGAKCAAKKLHVADAVDQPGPAWSWGLRAALVSMLRSHCEGSKLELRWPRRTPGLPGGQVLALYSLLDTSIPMLSLPPG